MISEVVLYAMDIGVLALISYLFWRSRTVVIESKTGNKWIIALLLFSLGVAGFFNYRGAFTWIQLAFTSVSAGMYLMLKSGLAEKGIVMVGSFITYEKAGMVTIHKKEHYITFYSRGNRVALEFDESQMNDVTAWLKERCPKGLDRK